MQAGMIRGKQMSELRGEETGPRDRAPGGDRSPGEREILQRLRAGDAEAGRGFVRDFYPGVHRYLLLLSGRPELAEDLTQETFLQAWRHLDQFAGRSSLRVWLHRIAHREFLQALRHQRTGAYALGAGAGSLEDLNETALPAVPDWTEAVVLRELLRGLPVDEREVVLLRYLHDYSSAEIAQIVGAPAATVRYWLARSREKLQRELGEGDLPYLNEPSLPMRQWAWLPLNQMDALAARLVSGRPGNPKTPEPGATREETMERREFLRHAAAGAAGLILSEPEREIIDDRLTRKVTLAVKATALMDLCNQLRGETGIALAAGPSVADEKVTLFCKKLPLRDVMRQLSRPFGYTWLRSGTPGKYRYELVQDLRSQLLEEELRNRDRNAALLALEVEIEKYRPYLDLSPDEALARAQELSDARGASPEEKKRLEQLAGMGWGPIQMYFRLSPPELAALRAGQTLTFSAEPRPGELPLPPDVARRVPQSYRDWRVQRLPDGRLAFAPLDLVGPGGRPATAVPEARALVTVTIRQSELGQFILGGQSGVFQSRNGPGGSSGFFYTTFSHEPYAAGHNPTVFQPDNAIANARLARDPALRDRISVQPQSSLHPSGSRQGNGEAAPAPRVTTADVLEAVHRATGLPIIADYYTRLYPPEAVSVRDEPLFQALNHLGNGMRLRWSRDGQWLQFRSASFYDDRLKEVPNRLLARWTASRREHGRLTLNDLVEIAQLPDAQLDPGDMSEGAKEIWGLAEWDLARTGNTRPHLRFLASFTPEQRQEAMSPAGLPFSRMSLQQQQQFLTFALYPDEGPLQSLDDLAGAALRVDYSQPGWFQWGDPSMAHSWFNWVVPVEPGPEGRRVLRPLVRERTPEAALEATQRLDPHLRESALQTVQEWLTKDQPQDERQPRVPAAAQIFPTELALAIAYIPGLKNARSIRILRGDINNWQPSW